MTDEEELKLAQGIARYYGNPIPTKLEPETPEKQAILDEVKRDLQKKQDELRAKRKAEEAKAKEKEATDPIQELVNDGTLSEKQAQAVREKLGSGTQGKTNETENNKLGAADEGFAKGLQK